MSPVAKRTSSRRPPRDPFDPLDGPVAESLDLHGFRVDEARPILPTFMETSRRRSPGGLVHIITGKGRNSPAGPVLKRLVGRLLRANQLPHVEAWGRDLDDAGYLIRLKGGSGPWSSLR